MIKIELSDSIIDLHKFYFKNQVDFNAEIHIEQSEVNRLSKILDLELTMEMINNEHKEFLRYCNKHWKSLSSEPISKLKQFKLDENIEEEFKLIKEMIKNNIKCKKVKDGEKCYKKSRPYSYLLIDLFSYEKFAKFNLSKYIKKNTKNTIKESEEIQSIIKQNYSELNDETIYELVKIIYNTWNIDKSSIIELINKGEFYLLWNAYTFAYMINLKVCPYCNRQYITPIITRNSRSRGDLDHILPKSIYPYFSMSIYNLIPTCKTCNTSFKGKQCFESKGFNHYEYDLDDIIKFEYNIKSGNLKIDLRVVDENDNCADEFLKVLCIKDQYMPHTNIVEDLVLKKQLYPNGYIKKIIEIFNSSSEEASSFDITEDKILELILGHVTDKKRINDEPLSKLKRDIVNQLDFNI